MNASVFGPNCFLLGAHKAGTTSVYYYLSQHPEIAVSAAKEPNYLSPMVRRGFSVNSGPAGESVLSNEEYLRLFRGAGPGAKVRLEASTVYLYDPEAPASIVAEFPAARAIIVLRHPAERAYSNYVFARRDGKEPLESFEQALAAEDDRIAAGWATLWHYRRKGYYAAQVERAFQAFGRERVHVVFYDDLRRDAAAVVTGLFQFLEVDSSFTPDVTTAYNRSGTPRSALLHRLTNRPNPIKTTAKRIFPAWLRENLTRTLLARVRNSNLRPPQRMAPDTRASLVQAYADDIGRLGDLTGRDLSGWLI